MDKRTELLEQIRTELGWTKTRIAAELGLGAMQNYSNWVRRKSVPKEYLRAVDDLISKHRPDRAPNASLYIGKSKVLPVISSVQAGAWSEIFDPYEPGSADDWQLVPGNYSDSAFILRVKGDSMRSTTGGLSIPDGSYVTVDPAVQAENGSIVVAKLEGEDQATIKKLVIEPPYKYLMPLNEQYGKIEINGNCRIVGVVMKIIQDAR